MIVNTAYFALPTREIILDNPPQIDATKPRRQPLEDPIHAMVLRKHGEVYCLETTKGNQKLTFNPATENRHGKGLKTITLIRPTRREAFADAYRELGKRLLKHARKGSEDE